MREKLIVLDLLGEAFITIEEALMLLKAMSENRKNKPVDSEVQGLNINFYLKGETDV